MKHILLLTDFSDSANNAINYALSLFKGQAVHFYLLHVHKSGSFTLDDLMAGNNKNVYDAILKTEKQALETFRTKLENENNNSLHQFSSVIDYDNLLSAIKQISASRTIDLIVAGYDGATSVFEMVFGSNTLQIIRHINLPTLVIPETYSFTPPKDVLLPLDKNDRLNTPEFSRLLGLLDVKATHFHVLRMNDENNAMHNEDTAALKSKVDLFTYHTLKEVSLADAVTTYRQLNAIDAIGLMVEEEGFFKRLIAESPKTTISKSLSLPLLIVHH
ncbi:universal stress protein [Mangrovimonas yunxiaonensis]|uniref:universal stress protein n=1 Tax=Mangrovimonas yunxiaonensis TaxID=1197477 RepID=UPI00056D1C9F|nr:universal stress protein [Mangrovimonas yunxiaonensis]GGH39375.1 hypothetical protein GCM10011364_08760 [Mangrovimonas yunxiaonensis]